MYTASYIASQREQAEGRWCETELALELERVSPMTFSTSLFVRVIAYESTLVDNDLLGSGTPFFGFKTIRIDIIN